MMQSTNDDVNNAGAESGAAVKPQPQPKKGLRYFIISQSLKLASADNNSAPINKISYRSNDTPMLQRTLSHKLLNNSYKHIYYNINN